MMISRSCSRCRKPHRRSHLQEHQIRVPGAKVQARNFWRTDKHLQGVKAVKGPLPTHNLCRIHYTKSFNSRIKLNLLHCYPPASDLALPETNGKTPVQALGNSVKGLAQVNGTELHTTVRPMSFAPFCFAVLPFKKNTPQ